MEIRVIAYVNDSLTLCSQTRKCCKFLFGALCDFLRKILNGLKVFFLNLGRLRFDSGLSSGWPL